MGDFLGKDAASKELWLSILSPAQRELRDKLVEEAFVDFTKDLDPRDEDYDFTVGLAREMAADLVDAITDDRMQRAAAMIPAEWDRAKVVTPSEWNAHVKARLERWQREGLIDPAAQLETKTSFDPATKTITTRTISREPIVLRQVAGPEDDAPRPYFGDFYDEVQVPAEIARLAGADDPDDVD